MVRDCERHVGCGLVVVLGGARSSGLVKAFYEDSVGEEGVCSMQFGFKISLGDRDEVSMGGSCVLVTDSADLLPFWGVLKQHSSLPVPNQSTPFTIHPSPVATHPYYSLLFATPQWPKSLGPPLTRLDPNRNDHVILPFPHGYYPFVIVPFVLPWYLVHIYSPPVVASSTNQFPSPLLPVPSLPSLISSCLITSLIQS